MIKNLGIILLLIFSLSCSSLTPVASERNQKWSNFFNEDEQKRLLFLDALKDLKTGKSRPSADHLESAQTKFQFLFDEFLDLGAKQRLVEIEKFRGDYKTYYEDLAKNAMQKKLIFTTAGYYKSIQRLFPDHAGAAEFFTTYEQEVPKRLERNLAAGNTYLKQKKLNSAKRSFNRILAYDPSHAGAKQGLNKIKQIKNANRLAAQRNKAKAQKKIPDAIKDSQPIKKEEPVIIAQTTKEQESLYLKGIKAYEAKDYLKAYELFEAIEDTTYKDTELYFNRSQDKIDALGLSDDN